MEMTLLCYFTSAARQIVQKGATLSAYAQELGAHIVKIEHRFYGESQPFGDLSTAHLRYLTIENAIEDLASFQTWMMQNKRFEENGFQLAVLMLEPCPQYTDISIRSWWWAPWHRRLH